MKYFTIVLIALISCFTFSNAQNTVGVVSYDETQTSPGYNLFYPLFQNSVYLIDNCGKIVNEWNDLGFIPGSSVELLPDGNLLKTSSLFLGSNSGLISLAGAGDMVHLKDWDNNTLWQYTLSSATERMHHDIKAMPNGNVLILAWEKKSGIEAREAGKDTTLTQADGFLYPDFIVEVKPEGIEGGTIVWRWNAWDHFIQDFDSTKNNYGVVSDHPELININYPPDDKSIDWLHTNAIDYNENLDHILISAPGFNEVWIIDHSTTTEEAAGHTGGNSGKGGDLIYRWGNNAAYNMGDSTDQKLFFQHDPHWIEQGLDDSDPDFGKLLLFNNQAGKDYSTVNIFAPQWDGTEYQMLENGTYGPESFDFTYQAEVPQELFSHNISGAQKLPNGNLLICSGVQKKVLELTPQQELVWQYINPVMQNGIIEQGTPNPNGAQLFRFNRYAEDFAGFDGKDLVSQDFVELNGKPVNEFCEPVSVGNIVLSTNIKVWPNPATEYIAIESKLTLKEIEMFNANGKLVVSQKPNLNTAKIKNLQTLDKGLYYIVINKQYFTKIYLY